LRVKKNKLIDGQLINSPPTNIEPGLPQRITFTLEPMTCGMLLRD